MFLWKIPYRFYSYKTFSILFILIEVIRSPFLSAGSLGVPNIKIPKLCFGKVGVDNSKLNNVRICIRQRPLRYTSLVRRLEKAFSIGTEGRIDITKIIERSKAQPTPWKLDKAGRHQSIDLYDEIALVVGKDVAMESFARTFANIDLDDGNQDSVPIDCDNEEIEEVRTKVSSSGTFKCKRKNAQESVIDE
ncbi:Polyribonucleotide nucleotidyltransferase [Gossypium arboreum]|uniref:Polyribonucleotide nucleotidyltransferase n=1 Tax=Gossypium arboreum TaxID=29729 RepID=A0A0B0MLN3_GOSAR|nr:Polyribonucleotide nucleotidyltransferase [Gossypium arboreum]